MTAETLSLIFGFLCHSTCESLPIHVSITTCMTDIDEAKWFQSQVKIQFPHFMKRKSIFWVFVL